jgi:chloride channel 7
LPHDGLGVVGRAPQAQGQRFDLQGLVLRRDVVVLLQHRAFGLGEAALRKVSLHDFDTRLNTKDPKFNFDTIRPDDMHRVLDLRPFLNKAPVAVLPDCPMSRIFTIFRSLGTRHLTIIDQNYTPVGIIARKDIMSSFNQDLS